MRYRAGAIALLVLACGAVGLWLAGVGGDGAPMRGPDPAREPASISPLPVAARSAAVERQEPPLSRAAARARVSGRIVDRIGRPLPGARVMSWSQGATAAGDSAVAATDGSFRLSITAAPPMAVTLVVRAPNRRLAVVDHAVVGAATEVGDVIVGAGGQLGGMVVGRSGATIRATVRLVAHSGPLARLPAWLLDEVAAPVVTGPRGRFDWSSLPDGAYAVEACAPHCERRRSERVAVIDACRAELLPLVLGTGHAVGGRVFAASGDAVAGAVVRLRGCGAGPVEQTTSASDGAFVFANLPEGPFDLEVTAGAGARALLREIGPGRELVVRMPAGASLRGQLFTAGGSAAAARVRVRWIGDLPTSAVAQQRRRLRAALDDCIREVDQVGCVGGSGADKAAALQRLAALEQQRCALEARHRPFGPPATGVEVTTADDGTFVLDGLEDGLVIVEVLESGGVIARSQPVAVRSGLETAVELVVPASVGRAAYGS